MTATLDHVDTAGRIRLARANQIVAGTTIAINHDWFHVTGTTTDRHGLTRLTGHPASQTGRRALHIHIEPRLVLQVQSD